MESNPADKPVPREMTALLSDERLVLRETQRAATQFGGIAVFISYLGKIGLRKRFAHTSRSVGSRPTTSTRRPPSPPS